MRNRVYFCMVSSRLLRYVLSISEILQPINAAFCHCYNIGILQLFTLVSDMEHLSVIFFPFSFFFYVSITYAVF